MNDRRTPQDLARRMKDAMSLRKIAAYYSLRSKRQVAMIERQKFAESAEYYRQLAELEEEVARIPPKPPEPSI